MAFARTVFMQAKDLWRELSSDDVSDFAAGLSYRFLLALFPFFIFVTATAGFISDVVGVANPSGEILARFGDALPPDARSVVADELTGVLERQQPGLLSIGLVGALWAASGGMGATMKAMNRVYDVKETRAFWLRTVLSVGLTVLMGVFFVTAFVLLVAGHAVAREAAATAGLGETTLAIVTVVRFLLVVALMLAAIAFLYWAAPNAHLPFRFITPGSVLFTAVFVVGTVLFGWYVSSFGSYTATYGALGGVVILMLWFYLTAYTMLAGAELNALLAQKAAPEATDVPAPEPGKWPSAA